VNSRRNSAAVIEPPPSLSLGWPMLRRSGDRRVERPPVVVDERHPPQRLAGGLGGGLELRGELVVGGEQPGVALPERHRHGAGQRGDVDDDVGLQVAVGVRQRVGQHEAALASVLSTSTVRPPYWRRTSPGRWRCRSACSPRPPRGR
jgi:hypothetical protein